MFSLVPKAALVWPPGGEGSHNKGAGVAGGVGGSSPPTSQQAAPQGLVHWMSVMAEHMNNPHHDAVHYMWNGVEVSTCYLCLPLSLFQVKRMKKNRLYCICSGIQRSPAVCIGRCRVYD